MTTNPSFFLALYVLVGLGLYFWSEPYRPRSAAAFDHCFRANRGVWFVMVFIATLFWPIMLINMAYRFFIATKKDQREND